jgi:G:T-mismatch repair DNA endonuclease (very short patch repair protein)
MLSEAGVEFVVHPEIVVEMWGEPRTLTPDIFVPAERLVIEVNGCKVHGCPNCEGAHANSNRRAKDEVRLRAFTRAGYDVDVYWEHEIVAA